MKTRVRERGLTLVELLIVIAIIGLVLAIGIPSISDSRAKSRDATRLSDLARIEFALEVYYEATGAYPDSGEGPVVIGEGGAIDILIEPFISGGVPSDPRSSDGSDYQYLYDTTTGCAEAVLYAKTAEASHNVNADAVCLASGGTAHVVPIGGWVGDPEGGPTDLGGTEGGTEGDPVLDPECTSFTASPASIQLGQSTTLSWATVNTVSVSISGVAGYQETSGSQLVSPSTDITYTLVATSVDGESCQAQVGVTVIEVTPQPAQYTINSTNFTRTDNGGDAYYTSEVKITAPDASNMLSQIQSLGGNPVSISDSTENAYVESLSTDGWVWLGLLQNTNSPTVDSGWYWLNGDPVTYTNWYAPQEPNDLGDYVENNEENYAHMFGGGQWNDIYLTSGYTAQVIFEIEDEGAPVEGGGPEGYVFCASEWGTCSFSGTADVAYGANGQFYYRSAIVNSIECKNSVFGDPISGVQKHCYILQ